MERNLDIILYSILIFAASVLLYKIVFRIAPVQSLRRNTAWLAVRFYPMIISILLVLWLTPPWGLCIFMILNIINLWFQGLDRKRFEQILNDEISRCEMDSQPPTSPANHSYTAMFLLLTVISLVCSLYIVSFVAHGAYHQLRGSSDVTTGIIIVLLLLFNIVIFYFLVCKNYFSRDVTELTPEQRTELRSKLVNYRNKKGWMPFIYGGVIFVAFLLSVRTSFCRLIVDQHDWKNRIDVNAAPQTETKELFAEDQESVLQIAAVKRFSDRNTNNWLALSIPTGFAIEEAGKTLWSELVTEIAREHVITRLAELEKKPLLESTTLAPDQIQLQLMFKPELLKTSLGFLKENVFQDKLESETEFNDAKSRVIEKFDSQKDNPKIIATKFALAAKNLVYDQGKTEIKLLEDLENATWAEFQDYYNDRFSQNCHPLLVSIGPGLTSIENQLTPFTVGAKSKDSYFLPEEKRKHKGKWDLKYPIIVASWTISDQSWTVNHAAITFAMLALEEQIRNDMQTKPETLRNLVDFHCDYYLTSYRSLDVYLSTVWKEDSNMDENLSTFKKCCGPLKLDESVWKSIKYDRKRFAESVVPIWWNLDSNTVMNFSFRKYRYENIPYKLSDYTWKNDQKLAQEYMKVSPSSIFDATSKYLGESGTIVVVDVEASK